jgi:hypothetical protein
VFIHNLRNYDGHFLIRELCRLGFAEQISIIPINSESYLSFGVSLKIHRDSPEDGYDQVTVQFLDSLAFLGRGLAELASNLPTAEFVHLRDEIKTSRCDRYGEEEQNESEWFEVLKRNTKPIDAVVETMRRKGVFPYDHVQDIQSLDERNLPTMSQFRSFLSDSDISDSDYEHAQSVWEDFCIFDLGMYSDLYLITDVMLLTCVFEKFRDISLQHYGLDPAHYFSTPGFAWEACLKETAVVLDAITDPEIYVMVERSIRGGLSQISLRHAIANNKQCADYDPTEPDSWLMYLDFNNLHLQP